MKRIFSNVILLIMSLLFIKQSYALIQPYLYDTNISGLLYSYDIHNDYYKLYDDSVNLEGWTYIEWAYFEEQNGGFPLSGYIGTVRGELSHPEHAINMFAFIGDAETDIGLDTILSLYIYSVHLRFWNTSYKEPGEHIGCINTTNEGLLNLIEYPAQEMLESETLAKLEIIQLEVARK